MAERPVSPDACTALIAILASIDIAGADRIAADAILVKRIR
jgi:hypothetical protein